MRASVPAASQPTVSGSLARASGPLIIEVASVIP